MLPLPPQWSAMLAGVEETLAEALRAADARDQALGEPKPAAEGGQPLRDGLVRLAERLRGFADRAARAEDAVAEADAALAASEDALRAWFGTAEAVRGKLADWANRA